MKIKQCTCGGSPEIRRVGDQKEYYICFCSKCCKTPVHFSEARCTPHKAIKVWNRRIDNKTDM